jgi:NADPH:quinone reductase-like Zn-dependent oxidoreductase
VDQEELPMKAIVLRESGPAENLPLEDVPDPQPGLQEVVVRLKAAALNHRDLRIRRGGYTRAPLRLPCILGSDGAGEVVAVGDGVDRSLLGRAVVIDPSLDWGPDERAQGPQYAASACPTTAPMPS